MPRPRLVVTILVTLLIVKIVWETASLLRPPQATDEMAHSYSGEKVGYRGVFDLLHHFGVPVKRNTVPPDRLFVEDCRVLLVEPDTRRLIVEKAYLEQMGTWVEQGGQLVVVSPLIYVRADEDAKKANAKPPEASDTLDSTEGDSGQQNNEEEDDFGPAPGKDIDSDTASDRFYDPVAFEHNLGLADLRVWSTNKDTLFDQLDWDDWDDGDYPGNDDRKDTIESVPQFLVRASERYRKPDANYPATLKGSMARLQGRVSEVALPKENILYFRGDDVERAVGAVEIQDEKGESRPVVLEFRHGEGTAILVADPTLLCNIGIGAADNATLAYDLCTGDGTRPVIFDEYYHGAVIRGAPLTLLARFPYGLIALAFLVATGLWVWALSVRFGPAAPERVVMRRDIMEYVDAMARLFREGKERRFVLKTCRDGFMATIRHGLQLPAGTPEDRILARMEQRAPEQAEQLRRVLNHIDTVLAESGRLSDQRLAELERMLQQCQLPKTTPH